MFKGIDNVPSSHRYSHISCDYIELLALVNNSDILSIEDIRDRFFEDEEIHIPKNESDENLGSMVAETDEKWTNQILGWFNSLEIRQNLYRDFYPFFISTDTIKLKEELSNKHKLYLFLLLNSNLKYIEETSKLTSDFEELSLIAFTKYLPSSAKVYRFGKSLTANRYTGHITNKIDKLAEDLKFSTKYKSRFFAENDNGDGGLDIVSWIPFNNDENQNNIQVFLGQCATGKEWNKKQWEPCKMANYIDFQSNPQNVIFIPYDGRDIDREFEEEGRMLKNIYFDRIRLLYLLESEETLLNTLNSMDIVNNAIEFEEDIV